THHITVRPPPAPPDRPAGMVAFTHDLVRLFEEAALRHPAQLDWIWYVIRCQERRGEVAAYEEGKILRSKRHRG
ncbi:MAG: hypothetical protein MUE60_07130, partial [Candidatus Eisenbacteria bacterium]|nr:hypothetical protein [Candidatus Eisenbacteria bacterium]